MIGYLAKMTHHALATQNPQVLLVNDALNSQVTDHFSSPPKKIP